MCPNYILSIEWKKTRLSVLKRPLCRFKLDNAVQDKKSMGILNGERHESIRMITLKIVRGVPILPNGKKSCKHFLFWIFVRCLFSFLWHSPGRNRWCCIEGILDFSPFINLNCTSLTCMFILIKNHLKVMETITLDRL